MATVSAAPRVNVWVPSVPRTFFFRYIVVSELSESGERSQSAESVRFLEVQG